MARRKQEKPTPTVGRGEFIIRSDDLVITPKAQGTQPPYLARCRICGREVEAYTLGAHEREVHKPHAPGARLKEILRDPDFTTLRSYAYSPSSCQVDVAEWQSFCAFRQEVNWYAERHASQLDVRVLAELQRILRFIERSFDDGWIKIRQPHHKSTSVPTRAEPNAAPALGDGAGDKPAHPRPKRRKNKQKRQWIHMVGGGLPGSAH